MANLPEGEYKQSTPRFVQTNDIRTSRTLNIKMKILNPTLSLQGYVFPFKKGNYIITIFYSF